jgi:hypothetical protein
MHTIPNNAGGIQLAGLSGWQNMHDSRFQAV